MTKLEALEHFGGNAAALGRFLGISRQAVNNWDDSSPIPELRIYKIQALISLRDSLKPNLGLAEFAAWQKSQHDAN